MPDEFQFTAIGTIETCFKERFGTPRQPGLVPSSWGILRLHPELNLADALDGLTGFSHLWLIFVFHQNTNKGIKTKVHPPRLSGAKTGLFATRTPHRPNPVGLSAVRLDKIKNGILFLSGVDLIDGTPILDIKPYLPSSDCLSEATSGWTTACPERTIEVRWTETARNDLRRFFAEKMASAEAAITELLELDPRPVFYKGTTEAPNPYTDVYGFRFDNFNVVYRMHDAQSLAIAEIQSLEPWADYAARSR